MFARVVISIFLIVAGIASPWLVKDWMDWRSDDQKKGGIYDRLSGFSDRFRGSADLPEPVSVAGVSSEASLESEHEQEPYPFATQAKRMLQGMFSSSIGVQTTANPPLLSSAIEASEKAERIVETTRSALEDKLAKIGLAPGNPIFIRVFKEENELELWMKAPAKPDYTLFKIYRMRDWSGKKGPKLREGDGQSPEGFYFVSPTRLRPETRHHLGFDLGFPNDYDAAKGRSGSGIMIHGGQSSAGSFVLSPPEMNEIYTLATLAFESGQTFFRVNSFPFRMTDQRMEKEWKAQPKWIDFWVNLKEGYDFFENVNLPPDVAVVGGEYEYRIY